MRPISLKLTNVFQHRDLVYDFSPGITGVVGRNGSGKSNLLEALYFAITGKTSSEVVKSDMVNWNDPVGYTELTFEHAAEIYVMRRAIHSATVKLSGGSLEKPLKSKDANAFMESALGFSFDRFYETCWTPQGGLITILTMGHSQRVAYFQRLADIRKAEVIRGVLQGTLNKLPAHPDRTDQIQGLDAELLTLSEQISQAKVAQEQLEALYTEYEAKYPDTQRILGLSTIEAYTALVTKAEQDRDAAAAAVTQFSTDNDIPVMPEVSQPDPELETARQKSAARKELLVKIEYSKQALDKSNAGMPELAEDPKELREQYEQFRQVVVDAKPKYDLALQGTCPTCARPFDFEGGDAARQNTIHEHQANTNTLQEMHSQLTVNTTAFNTYQQRVASVQGHNASHQAIIDQSQANLDTIGEVSFDEVEYQRQQTAWRDYSAYLARVSQHSRQMNDLNKGVQVCEGRIETAKATPYATAEAKATAEEFMRNYKELAAKRQQNASASAAAVARSTALGSQLKGYQEEQEKRIGVQIVRDRLMRAREVLHRDNLPKLVMQKVLVGLNAQLDSYLALFDTNFTAYINEDFDFIAAFATKSDVPARSLSGGQKVALALAFKFAVSDLLATQVPLMVLDEPTVWLDEINKPRLAAVMIKARAVAEKGNQEVVVATHEQSLHPAFSRVFDVGENSDY